MWRFKEIAPDVRILPMPMPTENSERGRSIVGPYYNLGASERLIPDLALPTVFQVEQMLEIDGQGRALEQVVSQPILGTPYFIEAGDEDGGEAQFVRDVLFKPPYEGGMTTPMDTLIKQATGGFSRRRVYWEKVWTRNADGDLVYHKLAYRPAETCSVRFDDNGSFDGFQQKSIDASGKEFEVNFDPANALVYIHDAATRPLEGRSMFASAYRNFVDKLKITQLYFYHCQNIALGSVVAKLEGGDPKAVDNLKKKAALAQGGGAVVLTGGEELEKMEWGRSADDFRNALQYLDTQMAQSFLASFITLGQYTDRGSWALSRDQSDFFLLSLESKLKELASFFTEYLVSPLVYYKFGPEASYPAFAFEPLSETRKRNALELWSNVIGSSAINNMRPSVLDMIEDVALPMVGVDPDQVDKGEPRGNPQTLLEGPAVAGGTPGDVASAQGVLANLLNGQTPKPGETLPARGGVGYPNPKDETGSPGPSQSQG